MIAQYPKVFYNYAGKAVYDKSGELVCVKPFPSMPIYFLDDEEGIKYKKAYFSKYPSTYMQVCNWR